MVVSHSIIVELLIESLRFDLTIIHTVIVVAVVVVVDCILVVT